MNFICFIYLQLYFFIFYFILFLKIFWPRHTTCGILVPWPRIEPGRLAVKVQSPNHWTAKEFPTIIFIIVTIIIIINVWLSHTDSILSAPS